VRERERERDSAGVCVRYEKDDADSTDEDDEDDKKDSVKESSPRAEPNARLSVARVY
jgi:hypothetical protein